LANALPQVREGKVKASAVTANTRSPAAPDIATVDEAGLAGLYISQQRSAATRPCRRPDLKESIDGWKRQPPDLAEEPTSRRTQSRQF
jgi:tripartite-type tricarboxylate transporter receptor subunit TctC